MAGSRMSLKCQPPGDRDSKDKHAASPTTTSSAQTTAIHMLLYVYHSTAGSCGMQQADQSKTRLQSSRIKKEVSSRLQWDASVCPS